MVLFLNIFTNNLYSFINSGCVDFSKNLNNPSLTFKDDGVGSRRNIFNYWKKKWKLQAYKDNIWSTMEYNIHSLKIYSSLF
jgi:hypothetical protein